MSIIKKYNSMVGKLRLPLFLSFFSVIYVLGLRVYVAKFFFVSGKLKWSQGYESTLDQFFDIYMFPVPDALMPIPVVVAMVSEILFPILLVFGLFTRFSAFSLLIMVLVIEFVLPASAGLSHHTHYTYMVACLTLVFLGGRAVSLDYFVTRTYGLKSLDIK